MNHWLSLGVGVGITNFVRWISIPIYASLRTYFTKSSGAGFCELNIGYLQTLSQGLSFAPSQTRSERFYGGLYLRPAIGYRFPTKLKTHVGIDLGCGIRHFRWGFQQLEPFPNIEQYQEEVVTIFSPSICFNILF